MNTERNMKRKGSLLGSLALSLIALVVAGLVQVQAAPGQTATTTATTTAPATTSASNDSSLNINVTGTAIMADGTKVTFSGYVIVNASAFSNVAGVPPFVLVTFDCTNVTATSGAGANKKTYDTRGFQLTKIRDLQATDIIVVTVPEIPVGGGLTLATPAKVTATLNFSTSGTLTSGTITASNNTTTTDPATGTVSTTP